MSTATLYLASTALAFSDSSAMPSQNPSSRYFDWSRTISVAVEAPQEQAFTIQPGLSQVAFSGVRTTSLDGTTQFTAARNALGTAYRFTYAAGTAPALKTSRALDLSSQTVTVTAQSDGTVTFASTGSNILNALQPNDVVFIPGVTTGDGTGPFSAENEGAWVVLIAAGSTATLQRAYDSGLGSASETVAVTAAGQVLGFANDGVQVGDNVDVSAGFVAQTRRIYEIAQVTPAWFEVVSTVAIPTQTAMPGVTGMQFYSSLKRWVRIEVDQECAAQFNNSSDLTNRISPLAPGDADKVGFMEKWGSAYALTLVNRSSVPMRARVWSAE